MELKRHRAVINYEVWGDDAASPLVVLVNGHMRPLNDFRMLGRHLIARGLRIAALDNRGAGATRSSGDFTCEDMVQDVLAVADAVAAQRPFRLLGISMGGFLAQLVTLAAPDRIERLALVSTAARQDSIRKDDSPWDADPDKVVHKLAPYFTAGFAQRNAALVKSMAKQIAQNVKDGDYAARADQQKRACLGFDTSARLGDIRAPTLVVHGDEDLIVPTSAGRELADGIPRARFVQVPDAGHLLLAERPKELYAAVGDFFS